MATVSEQIQQIYIGLLGRAADQAGLDYWTAEIDGGVLTIEQLRANIVNEQPEYAAGQGSMTRAQAVADLYQNLFNRAPEADGLEYWVNGDGAGVNIDQLVLALINGASAADQLVLDNKTEVAEYYTAAAGDDYTAEAATAVVDDVDGTRDSVEDAIDAIDAGNLATGETFTLTNGTDVATANVFNAPMVFTPNGDDRILSLQDEDVLTGTAGRTDNTLNVTMGNINANEGTTVTTTPYLNNIQNVNIDWTGNTTTLDLRNADATEAVNVQRVTSDATTVTVDNIGTPAADFRVANTASDNVIALFRFKQGVLTGDETLSLELNDVLANSVTQNARGAGAGIEGFEAVNLNALNGVDLANFSVNEMESLVITGSGALKIATLTPTAIVTTPEFDALGAPGIANLGAVGLLTLDASAFEGDLTLDITNSLGGFADPANSGQTVHGTVTGGLGDDTFWTSAAVAATSATNRDVINGGEGVNTLKTTSNIVGNASITNIQTLELRQQAGAQTVDFDAFDDAELTSVVMRDENSNGAGGTFLLNDVGAALAADGLVLQHSVTEGAVIANNATVRVRLADASGTNDTVAIRVENERNTETQFNYTLNFDGQANGVGAIENVTIVDADTEDNNVVLTAAQEHTGTVTLSGGRAGDDYTVVSALNASVIEASAQLSNLRLSVGDTVAPITTITQDIRLGAGDDILTFVNINDFDTTDSITDAGGNDTVRAAFSQNANLTLTGIEDLHIIANENVTLGMANADVENLVILAANAADGGADASPLTAEPFNVAGVTTADIITLNDTNLTELNFSADLDTDDDNTAANRVLAEAAARGADAAWNGIGTSAAGDAAYKAVISDESTVGNFNGVTLANNAATALTVNINANLDDVIYGATAYNLGQLTAHGITSMNIVVTDEDVTAGAANAVTTINNIWSKTMTSLTVSAADDVNLNTVSGAALNNSLTTFDASAVGGDLTATVISLGNNATVTLADGDNVFSALGSAGTNITINAGNGDNTITGSAQKDNINTGSGWDVVAGDRGDNVISTGAGNDTVTAKDGNDTFDVGTGIDTVTDNLGTGINATLATNTVSMSGGVTTLFIDVAGNGAGAGDIDQMLAVGEGSDLTLSWTGATLLDASAVLDGRLAVVENVALAATITGDANANLSIIAGAGSTLQSTGLAGASTGVKTVNAGNGNDVAMWTGSAAGDGLIFNGGAGNDAAVGTIDNDTFAGGMGADKFVLQDVAAVDTMVDTIVIADGDSTAAGWDVIVGFEAAGAAGAAGVVAGSTTAGDDVLDLASAFAAVGAGAVDGANVGNVRSHSVAAGNLVTFDDVDAYAAPVLVGTGAGQLSLANVLSYLATNFNGFSATVAFNYDADGDGVNDNTFVFQDGAADTVVELVGVYNGVEAVTGGTAGLIEIA
ncbi:DUF4214 domain-containing protein [Thauera aromatica]|uniref:DUF4214 domain-containing protein n=1 Tax=Thauera aromatica TaxID=59405 RepID=UPI001FFC40B4|nr:DUF4214 domain-containing protein [Thauera aromatica]MCK2089595.1 DUF4214 domain-containing protein [Thauera aromatica]